jgi:hypothetical protein
VRKAVSAARSGTCARGSQTRYARWDESDTWTDDLQGTVN